MHKNKNKNNNDRGKTFVDQASRSSETIGKGSQTSSYSVVTSDKFEKALNKAFEANEQAWHNLASK